MASHSSDNYFLPSGYTTNPAITYDSTSDIEYWNKNRRMTSRSYQKAVYNWASQLIRAHNCKTVADVGCGFADKLQDVYKANPSVQFYGIDQPNIISICKKVYTYGNWVSVDLENDPSPPEVLFDLVISSDVIEHLEDPDMLLAYIQKIVKPEGYVLISTPERDIARGPDCLNSPNKHHVREWNSSQLRNYIESRGFTVIEHRILPALAPFFSTYYVRHLIGRWKKGLSINYNQALLLKKAPQ